MQKFKESLYGYRWLLAASLLYAVVMLVMALAYGAKAAELSYLLDCFIFSGIFTGFCFGLMLAYFLTKAAKNAHKAGKPIPKLFDQYVSDWLTPERTACICVGFLLMLSVQFVSVGKSLINIINPYHWDPLFAHFDLLMHGGHYPHESIVPLVEKFELTRPLQWIYIAWFPYMLFISAWCIFYDTNRARQMRFFWSYLAAWVVLGTIAATVFASAGPYFMHVFYPDAADPYGALVSHLQALDKIQPLRMIKITNILIDFSHNGTVVDLNAISAMPSLHIGIAWLMALYAWSVNKYLFVFAMIFTAAIFTGAVYFGWHYAVDGYASILGVSMIWWIASLKRPNNTL